MRFYLAKTLSNMKLYGPIYDLTNEPTNRVQSYLLNYKEHTWFLENMVDDINAQCNTLLDDGDYDFFDVNQCYMLLNWLKKNEIKSIPNDYKNMLETLIEYSSKAIEYGTGIAIEL